MKKITTSQELSALVNKVTIRCSWMNCKNGESQQEINQEYKNLYDHVEEKLSKKYSIKPL